MVLIELKDYQEAKICLEKVIQINPKHEKAYNNLGSVLRELGDYQKAKECYEKAIQLDPNYVDAHSNLGNEYYEIQKYPVTNVQYVKYLRSNISTFNLVEFASYKFK